MPWMGPNHDTAGREHGFGTDEGLPWKGAGRCACWRAGARHAKGAQRASPQYASWNRRPTFTASRSGSGWRRPRWPTSTIAGRGDYWTPYAKLRSLENEESHLKKGMKDSQLGPRAMAHPSTGKCFRAHQVPIGERLATPRVLPLGLVQTQTADHFSQSIHGLVGVF